ncbi:hypothetical protein HDF16_003122 [Granulicella aggregans]|uniref:Alpha-L-rhamnosidase six-hairpin glycosidase domain-containing protein n=1 Tax=Granulicella aggregans TaxID=474949 RepID=A0A7W7ZET1_9BACT|nr:hypothetical protein [Granulicella aggregans]MBB5058408.1 hypothetical protein [Granulicella aggregans]
MTTRRSFLKSLPLSGYGLALDAASASIPESDAESHEERLKLSPEPSSPFRPLDEIRVDSVAMGRLEVCDGDHQVYFRAAAARSFQFATAGALGTHSVSLIDTDGRVLARRLFHLDCQTQIEDEGGEFKRLLKDLEWTMFSDGPVSAVRNVDSVYTGFNTWVMDNTNTMKGMRYFWPEVKSSVDFYVANQREDGMVWENFESCTPAETDWERRFGYGGFVRRIEDDRLLLRRAPVENHVEAYLIESIHTAWKTTGDTPWMSSRLDAAIRAVHYSTSDPYRWSERFKLLKRGFTVDTWDFLCASESNLVGGDPMVIDLTKTHFGIFFGDNTHLISGLRKLAEMLHAADRESEALGFLALAAELEERLNALCWNGEFFTHWVPEDATLKLDLGVDIARQVSLSNAYSLNYGMSAERCSAIVRTYQRIRKEMPSTSPGEFYPIYPPFERGFESENAKWEYMNGGVMSCVAGELALGAFQHGFESYGLDILHRYATLARANHGFVPAILRGKSTEAPARTFSQINLRDLANADTGAGRPGVVGWMGEPENDLRKMPHGMQNFRDVPFDLIDPATNARRVCIAISSTEGFARHVSIPINASARSFYLLHTKGGDDLVGSLTLRYADGSSSTEYIRAGVNIGHWWGPTDGQFDDRSGPATPDRLQVAWRGANQKFGNVGVYVAGFSHPHPEKAIASIDLDCLETDAKWMVLGLTLSDAAMHLPPWNDISFGMPNNWGAAALTAALIEGLAGVRDQGAAFSHVALTPRWLSSGVNNATVSVRYPASRGYVHYRYRFDSSARRIEVAFTGSAKRFEVAIPLPPGMAAKLTVVDGEEQSPQFQTSGSSTKLAFIVEGFGAHTLDLHLT